MFKTKIFKYRGLIFGVIGAFLLLIFPARGFARPAAAGGTLTGFIFGEDLQTPVESAVVKIRNMENQKEYQSDPTDDAGKYEIKDVEEGRYLLGVTTAQGDFNFDYSVLLKGGETAELSLALKPGGKSAAGAQGEGAAGGGGLLGFFTSTAGILILIAAGALLTFGAIQLLGAPAASPATKKK